MEFRRLGNSGLKVSAVGLGCNSFGRRNDLKDTRAIVGKALDLGITLFDTADVYNAGVSEEFLGEALGSRRKDAIIATKFSIAMGEGEYMKGGSRRYIKRAVDASLKRLKTDWIDLYQIHFPDPATPIEETLSAFDDLVHEGKVHYIGSSNFAGWQLIDALWTSKTQGLVPFIAAQNHYNLFERSIEKELIPACVAHNVGILPCFPLASGFLTGKYKRNGNDSAWRIQPDTPSGQRLLTDANFDKLERLEKFANEHGHSMLELASSWLLAQPQVSSVISGASSPEQVEANVKAGTWRMTAEETTAASAL